MDRLTVVLLLVIAVILITRGDYLSVHSQTQLNRLLGAPANAKINIEGALGVSLNQGRQSVLLSPSDITFGVSGAQLAILHGATSNVGIGTTLPSQKLHINPGKILLQGPTASLYFNDTNRGIMYSKVPNGSQSFTSNSPKDGIAIYGYLDGCLGTTDIANGGSKSILSWSSTGSVAINPPSTQSTVYPLAVYGATPIDRGSSYIYQNDPNTGTGKFQASIYSQYGMVSGAYGFLTLSDQRIKKNIQLCEGALSVINQIDVVSYEHIDHRKEKRVEYGVVAQQLQQCVPSAVHQIVECVPNIYQTVQEYIHGQSTTHLFFKERVPQVVGSVLKLVGDTEEYVRIIDQGTHSLIVEKFKLEGELFAYGTRENDFLIVDKLQLGVLALQGVKELIAEVKRLRDLLEKK